MSGGRKKEPPLERHDGGRIPPAKNPDGRAGNDARKTAEAGTPSLRGQGIPAFLPTSAESRQDSFCAKTGLRLSQLRLLLLWSAQEFVTIDGGDHAEFAGPQLFGAVHAAEAADLDRPGHGELVRQGHDDLHR